MNALIWILLAVALVAVGCAVYSRWDRNQWKRKAEDAEVIGMVNRQDTPDKCAGCMFALQNAAMLRQNRKALLLMRGGDFYAAQNVLEGGTENENEKTENRR